MKFDGEEFEYVLSTRRRFYAGALAALTVDEDGDLLYGHEGFVVPCDEAELPPEERKGLTQEERKEVAMHMMARWLRWAGAMPKGCDLHPTALETCDECPRIDLHVRVSLTPGAVAALVGKGGAS